MIHEKTYDNSLPLFGIGFSNSKLRIHERQFMDPSRLAIDRKEVASLTDDTSVPLYR